MGLPRKAYWSLFLCACSSCVCVCACLTANWSVCVCNSAPSLPDTHQHTLLPGLSHTTCLSGTWQPFVRQHFPDSDTDPTRPDCSLLLDQYHRASTSPSMYENHITYDIGTDIWLYITAAVRFQQGAALHQYTGQCCTKKYGKKEASQFVPLPVTYQHSVL